MSGHDPPYARDAGSNMQDEQVQGCETRGHHDPPLPDNNIPIVAFDMDSTLAESVWPRRREVGRPIPEGVALLKHYADMGYRIIIYTARPSIDKEHIWFWVRWHGLPVDDVVCDKPFAGLFVDDRAYCPAYTREQKRFNPEPEPDVWDDLSEEDVEELGRA